MIVTTGRHIKVNVDKYQLERVAETPGRVTVYIGGDEFHLPGNNVDAERFIAAYRRVLAEEVEYRKQEVE